MRLKLESKLYSKSLVKEVFKFVKPKYVKISEIRIYDLTEDGYKGWYHVGIALIRIYIDKTYFPHYHIYPNRKKFPLICIKSYTDLLVYLLAHECRHGAQEQIMKGKKSLYYPKSKGVYSEYDCEMYALDKLNEWNNR